MGRRRLSRGLYRVGRYGKKSKFAPLAKRRRPRPVLDTALLVGAISAGVVVALLTAFLLEIRLNIPMHLTYAVVVGLIASICFVPGLPRRQRLVALGVAALIWGGGTGLLYFVSPDFSAAAHDHRPQAAASARAISS